jgi:hypothetical protein
MDLCGVEIPAGLDGESFVSLLNSPDDGSWEDVAYSYFRNGISMRTPQYRMSKYFTPKENVTELYEYKQDIFERKNIADEKPEIVHELMPLWEKGNTFRYE